MKLLKKKILIHIIIIYYHHVFLDAPYQQLVDRTKFTRHTYTLHFPNQRRIESASSGLQNNFMGQKATKSSNVDPRTGKEKQVHYVKKLETNVNKVDKKSANNNDKSDNLKNKKLNKKKKAEKVPENPLNSYVSSYLRRLFKKFDLDKDNNLNPKEMKNLIVHLTGRKISKAETKMFLESLDENNDALIQRTELEHFVTVGINLSDIK